MTSPRTLLITAAFAAWALALMIAPPPTHALIPSAHASSATSTLREDGPTVKLRNTSARVVHLNLGARGGIVSINPLEEKEFAGDQASAAKEALANAYKALVDDGSLVVDGQPRAPAPNVNPPPSGTTTSMNDPGLTPTASELAGANTEPSGTGAPDTPSSAGAAGSSKRGK